MTFFRGNDVDGNKDTASGVEVSASPAPMHVANHFSRALRHVHFVQFFNLEESGVTGIGSSLGLARSRFTNIVNDDVVVCDLPFGVRIDSVDNLPHADGSSLPFPPLREVP